MDYRDMLTNRFMVCNFYSVSSYSSFSSEEASSPPPA